MLQTKILFCGDHLKKEFRLKWPLPKVSEIFTSLLPSSYRALRREYRVLMALLASCRHFTKANQREWRTCGISKVSPKEVWLPVEVKNHETFHHSQGNRKSLKRIYQRSNDMADPGRPPPYNYGAIPTDSGSQPPPPYPATGTEELKMFPNG